jgi:hypothetical protein
MPTAGGELLRFDFALGPDVDSDHIDARMDVVRAALASDRRWSDVRVTHVGSSDPELCYVLVWLKRAGRDAVEELQSDVANTVATILPGAHLSYGPGTGGRE